MPVFDNSKASQPGIEDFIYLLFGTLTLKSVFFDVLVYLLFGTLRASLVAQLVKNLPAMQETLVQFLGW